MPATATAARRPAAKTTGKDTTGKNATGKNTGRTTTGKTTTGRGGARPAPQTRSDATSDPAPAPVEPTPPAAPPGRTVNGLAVVREERVESGLSSAGRPVHLRISLLTLIDDTQVHGCVDCTFVAETRGEVQAHRMAEHGPPVKRPGRPRAAGALPAEIAGMTLAELLELAANAAQWGAMFDQQAEQLRAERLRADAAEAELRRITAALARVGFKVEV